MSLSESWSLVIVSRCESEIERIRNVAFQVNLSGDLSGKLSFNFDLQFFFSTICAAGFLVFPPLPLFPICGFFKSFCALRFVHFLFSFKHHLSRNLVSSVFSNRDCFSALTLTAILESVLTKQNVQERSSIKSQVVQLDGSLRQLADNSTLVLVNNRTNSILVLRMENLHWLLEKKSLESRTGDLDKTGIVAKSYFAPGKSRKGRKRRNPYPTINLTKPHN